MIIANKRGDKFLRFMRGNEAELTDGRHAPITHALVVAKHGDGFLIIFNRWRKIWELPGGMVDPGETTRECAGRELQEETGQTICSLRFVGIMEFCLQPDSRIEYGALYAGELEEISGLGPTIEAEQVILWDLHSEIGVIDKIDRTLMDYYEPV